MKKIVEYFVPSVFMFFLACTSKSENPQTVEPVDTDQETILQSNTVMLTPDSVAYSSELFEAPGTGWGYRILESGNVLINQPHIPAVPGNSGFQTSEEAQQTADLAIYKIRKGIMPPTISVQELDSMGIVHN